MSANLARATPSIETLAPFRRSREFPTPVPAQVEGSIPGCLRGEVVRTCPAVFDTSGWHAQHRFDGLCMLYAFRIGDAGIDFRSRLLDSEAARDAWHGKTRLGSFGTPTDAGIVTGDLRVERMAARLPDLRPSLVRIVMRPGAGRASMEKLSDAGFDFPSTNDRQVSGRPYRYAHGAAIGYTGQQYAAAIMKADVDGGASASFSEPGIIFGEPLFVARPDGTDEDDGVLLSVGSDRDADESVLAIIDRCRADDTGRAGDRTCSIPLGFHGSFVHAR